MKVRRVLFTCAAVAAIGVAAAAESQQPAAPKPGASESIQLPKTKSVEGTTVYFISPKDGDTVDSTFTVRFGLKGMGVAPAGIQAPNTGHHHLLIDAANAPDPNAALPVTDNIRHFGAGQTEAEIKLPPGKHTLQLVFADYLHIPHDKPVMSEKITVTVK
jgi:hypothetical protein